MIYLTCPVCGYAIDIMADDEVNIPVRAKRLKYLTTRDQVCPNCVNTIGRCEKVEAKEEDTPILRVEVQDSEKENFVKFCRDGGYAVATEYTMNHFKEEK